MLGMSPRTPRPRVLRTWSTMEELNYQRRGERGVDYDEYGAEMEPNARVWSVYVDETDKADRELVDGWNGSMDVMLIFAALFSAILTAFVLESSKDLKPDYTEISARALLILSNTSSTTGPPNASQMDPSNFTPTAAAVMVNTLWFLSLGLSIAVTLIAILAKEWCYSFMTRRTGAKLTQGRLRQKRWDGIRQWKMEEIISTLPLLMHISLLLFAIGLVIYLWDINPNVALPVMITTILTALYYIITAFLALLFKYCPYTTAVVKLFYPLWTAVFGSIYFKALFHLLIITPAFLLLHIVDFKNRISGKQRGGHTHAQNDTHTTAPRSPLHHPQEDAQSIVSVESCNTIHAHVQEFEKKFYHRVEQMHKDFLIDNSQYSEDETPMDQATSAMLLWMITNCEDPKSVDLALQALAGADLWLPVEAFSVHEIDFQVLRKLERCLYVLESPHIKNDDGTWSELLDRAHLYSRALATVLRGAPKEVETQGVTWNEWENCMKRMHKILKDNTNTASHAWISQSTDFEFGTLLLEGSQATHTPRTAEFYAQRRERRWEILKQITTNQVTGIPPSASSVRSLVNVITGTLIYAPRSPLPLVELFNAYNNTPGTEDATLAHSIGIALTISRFTDTRYDPVPVEPYEELALLSAPSSGNLRAIPSRQEHAQMVYNKLANKQPTERRTRALLTFGLLGLLGYPADHKSYLEPDEIKSIGKALQIVETPDPRTQLRKSTLLTREDQSMRYLGYHKLMPMTPPTFELESQFETIARSWLRFWLGTSSPTDPYSPPRPDQDTVVMYLEALLTASRCQLFGKMIVDDLISLFMPSEDDRYAGTARKQPELTLRAQKLCVRSITYSITDWPGSSKRHKGELNDIVKKIKEVGFRSAMVSMIKDGKKDEEKGEEKEDEIEKSTEQDRETQTNRDLVPYAMRFIWNLTITRTSNSLSRENQDHRETSDNDRRRTRTMPGRATPETRTDWTCVRHGPFEAKWFNLIQELCDEDYENVMESGILDELVKPCEDKCYLAPNPRPTPAVLDTLGLQVFHEGALTTWVDVYKRLLKQCREKRDRDREERERELKEREKERRSPVAPNRSLTIDTKVGQAITGKSEITPENLIVSGSRRSTTGI